MTVINSTEFSNVQYLIPIFLKITEKNKQAKTRTAQKIRNTEEIQYYFSFHKRTNDGTDVNVPF